jgi:hypothetical protein
MKTTYQLDSVPASGIILIIEGMLLRIMFNIVHREPTEDEDGHVGPDNLYDLDIVDVTGRSKGEIISAIVNDRYTSDQVQALTANYALATDPESGITDEKRTEYLEEYHAYQEYRASAKTVASQVVVELENM